jgi:hypothetical protein
MKSAKLTAVVVTCLTLLASVGTTSAAADFGLAHFAASYQDPTGAPLLQAGSHADVTTQIHLNLKPSGAAGAEVDGSVRDIEVNLPAGLTGNPRAADFCVLADLVFNGGFCKPSAQVGLLRYAPATGPGQDFPVYNLKAPDEQTAVLGVIAFGIPSKIVVSPRTDGDYGLTTANLSLNQGIDLAHLDLTIWGVPAAAAHDPQRFEGCAFSFCLGHPAGIPAKPFLSLPTRCEPMVTEVRVDSWQKPGEWISASVKSPPLTGCDSLEFAPRLKARPTTNAADSPSGLDLSLNLPQNADDPEGLAPAHVRKVEVNLPDGLVVNPAGANGLGACTLQQIGYNGLSNERQLLRYDLPRANSFTVGFGGRDTAPISATAKSAVVAQAIETLPGLAGNVAVNGGPGSWTVAFVGALGGTDVPLLNASATDNRALSVDVTGEGGGFNLSSGGASTLLTFNASFPAGTTFIQQPKNLSRSYNVGELIEGPGIAPGTKIIAGFLDNFIEISQPTTEAKAGVQLKGQLQPDLSAAALQIALEGIPTLGSGNVLVADTESGSTHSYEVLFVRDLAGAERSLTATSSLTGPGAGVVIAPKAPAQRPVEVTTTATAGVPSFDRNPAHCADSSRIGSVEVDTPVYPDPLKGALYTMTPYDNPFGTLLGLYIVVEGHGIVVKLPARVSADPQTGRLTNTLEDSPQLPIEEVRLKVDGGAFGVLRTPATCGVYATTSTITPWSFPATPAVSDRDEYGIEKGPNGNGCGALANSPSFEAGSLAPIAGQYKPFTVNLRREDGSQEFSAITVNPPPGLVAKLKGTPICSDGALAAAAGKSGAAEKASPSCPAASEVGHVYATAGAGPSPYNAPGLAYLAGPYKGAPLSFAIVTPATAGPFDLGTIVIRAAAYIDPKTAQVTVKSDSIPRILQGIPLDVRSVSVRLDKPEFVLNPTSCDPSAVTGTLLSAQGASAALNSRFQLAECSRLQFKPSLKLSLKGGTKRGEYPALTAVLTNRAGDANISSVQVALPHSEFLAQNHIRTLCTRVQFAADACPAASIYGKVSVVTPILDYPLTGPVYLRSSSNPLPDLVTDLHGPAFQPIRFEAAGKTDSINGGLRNTFDFVPDVPFSKLTLQLQGGKKGLLQNSRNICKSVNRANASYTAHNGLNYVARPMLKAVKCKKGKPAKGKKGAAKKGKRGGKG